MSLVLVDTSVWIDLFSRKPAQTVALEQMSLLATCPPVIQEILQGISDERAVKTIKDSLLALPCISASVGLDTYLHAADLYRRARKRGYTVRSATDCLIGAIALEADVAIWHRDRDFAALAAVSDLRVTDRL